MEYDLTAQVRKELGKGAARKLRAAGLLPAVKYGHGEETAHIKIERKEFEDFLTATRGESSIINLKVGRKTQKAMVKRMARDPVTGSIQHVDFIVLHKGEEVTVRVPIVLTGEPAGVKLGGVLDQLERQVRIKSIPKNIPAHLEIDITEMEIGDSFHIKDLPQENITILADPEDTVVTILAPRKIVEEVPEVEELEEGEEVPEGEETPAEGEARDEKAPEREGEGKEKKGE
jgi:large subunit ribosomal protein L25